jgi:hypothetical protein
MKEYHVIIQGVQSGPFPESTIQSMIFSGEVKQADLCWADGMAEWQPLHSVIEPPPPLPDPIDKVQSYYICNNDEPKGPYTETQLRAMWLNGLVLASTLYWRDGMAEWQPVAELCDAKPQSTDAKKIFSTAVHVVRSVYTSAERNISEFNDELDRAKANDQHPSANALRHLTTSQKLAQGAYAFFTGIDKTVTRIALLRDPPLPKQFIYSCAAFAVIIIFGIVAFSLHRYPHEEQSGLFATYPVIGENLAQTKKRLNAQDKQPEPSTHPGLSTIVTGTLNDKHIIATYFSGDTVVAFYCFPLAKYMDDSERKIFCNKKHSANVQNDITSVYRRTKTITMKGSGCYDGLGRHLIFIQHQDGTLLAAAEEYLAAMGVDSLHVTVELPPQ